MDNDDGKVMFTYDALQLLITDENEIISILPNPISLTLLTNSS